MTFSAPQYNLNRTDLHDISSRDWILISLNHKKDSIDSAIGKKCHSVSRYYRADERIPSNHPALRQGALSSWHNGLADEKVIVLIRR